MSASAWGDESTSRSQSGPRAGFWRRFAAAFMDGLGVGLIILILEAVGKGAGYGRGFVRYIGRIVSNIPIYLGYFWMLWDRENQTWHDKFAGSVVVPVADYPPPSR